MKIQNWAAVTAAFAAGTLAAVGISSAAAPQKIPDSTTGVITACMVKKTGAVRFINAQAGKTCTKREKKVTFNQTGPAGAPGERGPSNAYVANTTTSVALNSSPVLPGQSKNRVVQLTLPAGDYVLAASTSAHRTDVTTSELRCEIRATSGTVTTAPLTATVNVQQWDVPFAATATYSNTAEGTVYLRCDPYGSAMIQYAEANGGTLTATRVGSLTTP